MKLVYDWRLLVKKAWSLRLIALSALFIGIDTALPFFAPDRPSIVFAVLAGACSIGAFVARLMPQKGITDDDDT